MSENIFLEEFKPLLEQTLIEQGISLDTVTKAANAVMLKVIHEFGGIPFYIPKKAALPNRNALIIQEFNGKNHHALARKYGLTPASIYEIVRIHRLSLQKDLFN